MEASKLSPVGSVSVSIEGVSPGAGSYSEQLGFCKRESRKVWRLDGSFSQSVIW